MVWKWSQIYQELILSKTKLNAKWLNAKCSPQPAKFTKTLNENFALPPNLNTLRGLVGIHPQETHIVRVQHSGVEEETDLHELRRMKES